MGVTTEQIERWERIAARYEMGEPVDEIAAIESVDRKTVHNVARRFGLDHRHVFDEARTARIVEACARGEPVTSIAAREGVHRTQVRNVASRAGLPPRKDWQRRYSVDHSAFDEPGSIGWWLIGLLAADGGIGPGNLIHLTQSENGVDVLHEFLGYHSCERPLTELKLSPEAADRAYPRAPAFAARIHSRQIREALATHGIVERKSRNLTLSDEAAAEPAVWLGLLDGDGWVSERGRRGRPRMDFFGAPGVMTQCAEFWGDRLRFQRSSRPAVCNHAGGLRRVAIHGANAGRAAQLMLESSPISLGRKRRTLHRIVDAEAARNRKSNRAECEHRNS